MRDDFCMKGHKAVDSQKIYIFYPHTNRWRDADNDGNDGRQDGRAEQCGLAHVHQRRRRGTAARNAVTAGICRAHTHVKSFLHNERTRHILVHINTAVIENCFVVRCRKVVYKLTILQSGVISSTNTSHNENHRTDALL